MSENNTETKVKRKVYAFDDNSIQAKVMFVEHQRTKDYDLQSVQIKLPKPLDELEKLNLEDYIKQIPEEILNGKQVVKIDLHFTADDFDKFGLEDQVNQLRAKYPNISIIKSYSFMSKRKVERLAKSLGLVKEKKPEPAIEPLPEPEPAAEAETETKGKGKIKRPE
jgi:hypothetical protein